jgi:hypothetical protein
MDRAGVGRRRFPCGTRVQFEDDCFAASLSERPSDGQADDTGADHDNLC